MVAVTAVAVSTVVATEAPTVVGWGVAGPVVVMATAAPAGRYVRGPRNTNQSPPFTRARVQLAGRPGVTGSAAVQVCDGGQAEQEQTHGAVDDSEPGVVTARMPMDQFNTQMLDASFKGMSVSNTVGSIGRSVAIDQGAPVYYRQVMPTSVAPGGEGYVDGEAPQYHCEA